MGKKDIHQKEIETKDILSEQLIIEYLETHTKTSSWNESQFYLIVESITNAINAIVETYFYYPGSAVYLLTLLKKNNTAKGKDETLKKHLMDYSYAMAHVDKAHELFELSKTSSILYQIGINHLYRLNLRPLQGNTAISTMQFNETHNILDFFLNEALNALKASSHYKTAKQEGHLYYPEPPIIIDGKRINSPLVEPRRNTKEKKRKREENYTQQSFFKQRNSKKQKGSRETQPKINIQQKPS